MGDVDILGKVWLKEAATDLARLVLREARLEATSIGSVTLPSIGRTVDATFEPLAPAVLRSSDAVLDELTRLVIACPTDDAQLLERLRALLGSPPP